MFGLDTLDVAISVILLFLVTSLLCSAMREALEAFLKTRGVQLEQGIRELLQDASGALVQALYEHPLIYSLYRGDYKAPKGKTGWRLKGGNLPSYIPAAQFSTALLDIVHAKGVGPDSPLSIASLRSGATALAAAPAAAAPAGQAPPDYAGVAKAVNVALDHAQGDVAKAQANIETWFNGTMDRVSGWYRRDTQVVLFVIGLFAAVVLNLDTVTVAQRVSRDKALRSAVVAEAQAIQKQPTTSSGAGTVRQYEDQLDAIGLPIGWVRTWPAAQVTVRCLSKAQFAAATCSGPPPEACGKVPKPGFPCSIVSAPASDGRVYELTWGALASMIVGWLITAIAVTMGAPFWFNTLNSVLAIRSTVKPDPKSEKGAAAAAPG